MPTRSLPQADAGNLEALEGAAFKLTTIKPGEPRILTTDTEQRIQRILPRFRGELSGRQAVSGQQTEATSAAEERKSALRLSITHFFKTLNMAIERGADGFRAGDRTYYGLDASQETLPKMEREAALLRVARTVVSGEAKRIAAGGKPLPMPSAKQIETLLQEVTALLTAQQHLISANDKEAQSIGALRDEVSELVRDIWDELEFAYRKESAPTLRRRCREWGVVYTKTAGETDEESESTTTAQATSANGSSSPTPASREANGSAAVSPSGDAVLSA